MSRITELAVAKRSVTLLLAAALFVAGIYAWGQLKQELLPDIEFPVITIIAPYPGAGAGDVTDQVTKPIERAVSGVPRLEQLQSTSANSISVVVAQFSFGTDVKETRAAIELALADVGLPAAVEPSVTALNINETPVIIASVTAQGEDGLATAGQIAETEIAPALLGLEGVSDVTVTGGLQERAEVTLDPAKLTENGISVGQITGVLAANNLTLPSGQVSEDDFNIPVSTSHQFDSIDEIGALIVGVKLPAGSAGTTIPGTGSSVPGTGSTGGPPGTIGSLPGGATTLPAVIPTPITLGELGTVELVQAVTTGYARVSEGGQPGQEAVTITVSKSSGANTVSVADAVTAELGALEERYGGEITVTVISDLSNFITESRDGLLKEGGLGAIFAILTILFFLGSLRSTLVAAVSIPLSILTALVVMLVTGISINIMTLGGLAVAIGRVVDDSIVVLENIYRHRARGDERLDAVLSGTREVATAITASTATTVAVFLPLGFVGGLVSEFFLPFALTVTFALLASLGVALTVVPVLAYFLVDRVRIEVDETGEPKRSIWVRLYTPTIKLVLSRRATKLGVIALATILFFVTTALVPFLSTAFISTGSEKNLQVIVVPPPGASSEAVLARSIEAEDILRADEDVELIATGVPAEGETGFATISSAFAGRPSNSGTLFVRLDPSVDLQVKTREFVADLEPIKTDGYDVIVDEATGAGGSSSLSIIVSGNDQAEVAAATATIVDALADQPDLVNLTSDLAVEAPEIQVAVDPNKAIGAGLTTAQVAGEIRTILVGQTVTRSEVADGQVVDLYLRVDPTTITSVDALRSLPVGTTVAVPLGAIAAVDQAAVQGSITRIDQEPAASISAGITSDDTGAVSMAVQEEIDALEAAGAIPEGVNVRLAGVTQQMNEAFSGLYFSMFVAIVLVYVMMVLVFNSLITPFIILFSLPLATIGAFPALFITGRPIGISALIGFLMLIGIVVTNAIVLLDLVERLRRQGETTYEALVEGGRTRVRPILMTAIATILALMPLAAGLNEGSIIAAELGTVVIGGLFSSTFLTLIVIPVLYSLVDGGKIGISKRFGQRQQPQPEPVPVSVMEPSALSEGTPPAG